MVGSKVCGNLNGGVDIGLIWIGSYDNQFVDLTFDFWCTAVKRFRFGRVWVDMNKKTDNLIVDQILEAKFFNDVVLQTYG